MSATAENDDERETRRPRSDTERYDLPVVPKRLKAEHLSIASILGLLGVGGAEIFDFNGVGKKLDDLKATVVEMRVEAKARDAVAIETRAVVAKQADGLRDLEREVAEIKIRLAVLEKK